MSRGAVLEHLDPVEDCRRQFESSTPLSPVGQLSLHPAPEAPNDCVEGVGDGTERPGEANFATRLAESPRGGLKGWFHAGGETQEIVKPDWPP